MLIVATVFLTFSRLMAAEFLTWDDWYNLSHNPWLNPPTWAAVAHYWTTPAYGLYIPVTYTLWAALAAMGYVQQVDPGGVHLNPYLFHAANIAVHAAAAVIAFELLLKLKLPTGAACAGALLFALHPVQVEAVAWTAGLKDVLAGMLGLLALLLYVEAVNRRGAIALYAIALFVAAMAMLAKPSAVMIAPIVVLIDRYWLRSSWAAVLQTAGPWLALAVAGAILGKIVQPAIGVIPAPLWQRPLVTADAVAFYCGKVVWPTSLGIDYGRTPAAIVAHGAIYWTWLIPVALSLFLVRLGDRLVWIAAGVFVLALLPTSGLVTFLYQYFSTVADHYLYLPMFGFALAVAAALAHARRWMMVLCGAVLIGLAITSYRQAGVWHDDSSLFRHAISVNPNSFMATNNLGQSRLNAGDVLTAEDLFKHSIQIKPDDVQARTRLAEIGESRAAWPEAIEHRQAALAATLQRPPELQTDLLPTLNGLVRDLIEAGQRDQAEKFQRQAEQLNPSDVQVRENATRLMAVAR